MNEREIEFRGKRIDNGEWVYGGYHWDGAFPFIIATEGDFCVFYGVIPETVGQYTGRKDKTGVQKIYAGDRIYFSVSKTQHYRGVVVWNDKDCCCSVQIEWEKQDAISKIATGYEMGFCEGNQRLARLDSDCFDIEVIVNVHVGGEVK